MAAMSTCGIRQAPTVRAAGSEAADDALHRPGSDSPPTVLIIVASLAGSMAIGIVALAIYRRRIHQRRPKMAVLTTTTITHPIGASASSGDGDSIALDDLLRLQTTPRRKSSRHRCRRHHKR